MSAAVVPMVCVANVSGYYRTLVNVVLLLLEGSNLVKLGRVASFLLEWVLRILLLELSTVRRHTEQPPLSTCSWYLLNRTDNRFAA